MITLREGLKLAIKANACKGNLEAFKKALSDGDTLECYQIAFGNYEWLLATGIIKEYDIPKLEKLARGVGKSYYNNGQLYLIDNYKNGKHHGLYEVYEQDGKLHSRTKYRNGEVVS